MSSSTQQKKFSDICGSARISLRWMGIAFLQCAHQGVPSEAEQYQNIYQSGYFIETEETRTVNASFKGTKETRTVNPSFIEWDMGFDFLAATDIRNTSWKKNIDWLGGCPRCRI